MFKWRKPLKAVTAIVLLLSWFLFGWPAIWLEPRIPPAVVQTRAASGDVILLWDTANGAIPAGWTCISCTGGDAYYGVFPRAAAAYDASTGGTDSHTQTLTYSSATQGADGTALGTNASNRALLNDHTHTWGNTTAEAGDVKPPFKNLNFIYKNAPATIPANVIGIFDTGTLPSGWTRYAAMDGNYLRGYSDNATGGSATHTHTVTAAAVTSGNAAKILSDSGSGGAASTDLAHTLPATNTDLTAANNAPQYLEVIFAYNSSGGDTTIPNGLIAMFDTTLPGGWAAVSNSAPWTNSFLKGAATYGGTGGANTDHNHTGTVDLVSDASSTSLTNLGTTGAFTGAQETHTHTVTYTIDTVGSLPLYRDTVFAKYTAPTISVSVVDGGVVYGMIAANSSKSTLPAELNDMQTATNDGNATETFNIKGQDATGGGCTWTLGATAASDQYVHQFCNDTDLDCTGPPTNYTTLTTNYQTLKTGVAVSGTATFQLRLTTPNPSSCYGQQSVDVTVQAVVQ